MKWFVIIGMLFSSPLAFPRIDVPTEAHTFEFNINTYHMGKYKENKLWKAVELIRLVFATPDFKDQILKHRFQNRYQFANNKGLSNRRIYEKILQGVEVLNPYANNAMDLDVVMYTDLDSIVIGYTRPSTKRIWINSKYFNRNDLADIAGTLTHEWLHKLGFDHERERTKDRKYSVPYGVGSIVREIARKLDENNS